MEACDLVHTCFHLFFFKLVLVNVCAYSVLSQTESRGARVRVWVNACAVPGSGQKEQVRINKPIVCRTLLLVVEGRGG